jgi:hypothetical protein
MSEPPTVPYIDHEVIRLTASGVWLADDEEITHERTVSAFQRYLFPTEDGKGWEIRIGRERKRIEVEDTAFFVRKIEGTPETGFRVFLTDGTEQELDPNTLRYRPGRLTCEVLVDRLKKGSAGRAEARFLRAPYIDILSFIDPENEDYILRIGKVEIKLTEEERG